MKIDKLLLSFLAACLFLCGLVATAQKTTIEFSDPEMAKHYEELLKKRNDTSTTKLDVLITSRSSDGAMRSTETRDERRLVQVGQKFGFENASGQLVIPCTYDFGENFHDGLAVVGKRNPKGSAVSYYKWHINKDGKRIYRQNYCDVSNFVNGYAVVDVTGGYKICHIKKDGTPLYPERYTRCWDFNQYGRAMVEKAVPEKDLVTFLVIDTTGTVIGSKRYSFRENRMDEVKSGKQVKADLAQWMKP